MQQPNVRKGFDAISSSESEVESPLDAQTSILYRVTTKHSISPSRVAHNKLPPAAKTTRGRKINRDGSLNERPKEESKGPNDCRGLCYSLMSLHARGLLLLQKRKKSD